MNRPNQQSTIFVKAVQRIANWELAPPFGATLPTNVSPYKGAKK
jgi:hypothetical protein